MTERTNAQRHYDRAMADAGWRCPRPCGCLNQANRDHCAACGAADSSRKSDGGAS